ADAPPAAELAAAQTAASRARAELAAARAERDEALATLERLRSGRVWRAAAVYWGLRRRLRRG
ncbi:MAG TPA: hypothetical protein VF587_20355, partial [Solirubrobacteraceae bacterium]